MYWLCYFYFWWINFWRLPETTQTRRARSAGYEKKVIILRVVWFLSVLFMSATGHLAFFISGLIFLTFLSFMFLDES